MRSATSALAAAAFVAAFAVAPVAPSAAFPACSGITVVVDFHQLEHDDVTTCVREGSHNGARLLRAAGLELDDVQSQPGFICRVDGLPAGDPCVSTPPASRYWSLWWSRPGGDWVYSTLQASSLRVPEGGAIGLVWDQDPDGELTPGVVPAGAPPSRTSAEPQRHVVDDPGGLPGWAPISAIGVLVAMVIAADVERRRRS